MFRYSIRNLLLFVFITCNLIITPCFANQAEQFKMNTQNLLQLLNLTRQGKIINPAQAAHMKVLVREREKLLTDQQAPQFYNYLLPADVTAGLPQSLQPLIEREVTHIKGVLEIRAELSKDDPNREVIYYLIRSEDNNTYSIRSLRPLAGLLKTGDTIDIVKAFLIPKRNGAFGVLLVCPDDIKIIKHVAESEVPKAFGPQPSILMLVNFSDDPNNRPWSISDVKAVLSSVNDMFYEASFKQTTVPNDVVGWYIIPLTTPVSCNTLPDDVARLANQAATNAGVDLSKYMRRAYLFPGVKACGWAGLGTVGGTPGVVWLNGYNNAHVTGHEFGHNLTLYHSHSLQCPGSPNQGSCTSSEYGDVVDTMGQGWEAPHFNAFQKERLGWLNFKASPPILNVATSGSYMIDPYETNTMNPKALKILKGNGNNGSFDYYYLEFRQPIGFDAGLNCTGCNYDYTKGVVFHQANSADPNSSQMLDMAPNDDRKSVTLHPGQSFQDMTAPNGGVTFTVQSISSAGAAVDVTFGSGPPPSCTHANPTLTINPSTTQWVTAGGKASWTVTIQNNDSSQCAKSVFKLTRKKPPLCMQPILSQTNVALEPGASTTVDLTIATASWLAPNVYNIFVIGTNISATNYTGQVAAALGVKSASATAKGAC